MLKVFDNLQRKMLKCSQNNANISIILKRINFSMMDSIIPGKIRNDIEKILSSKNLTRTVD